MRIPGIDGPLKPAVVSPKQQRKRRPPRRVCSGCSQMFWGYSDHCKDCAKDAAPDRKAVADAVRERRSSEVEKRMERAHFNEFPEGF